MEVEAVCTIQSRRMEPKSKSKTSKFIHFYYNFHHFKNVLHWMNGKQKTVSMEQ